MKALFILLFCIIFCPACAKMQVGGTKEPIKMDISMRLDIYQHVQKDIDEIENIVSGPSSKTKEKTKSKDKQILLNPFVCNAYAGDLTSDVEDAALRRKDRRSDLISLQKEGVVGENKSGLVEIKSPEATAPEVERVVEAENADRLTIYNSIAEKNDVAVEQVQKIYSERLQEDAPEGAPIEVVDESKGTAEWKKK